MDALPEDMDPRLAYIVMLNGMEEEPLWEVLGDLRPPGFVADSLVFPAAQRALRYLVANGRLDVILGTRSALYRILDGDERESAITAADCWVNPADDRTTFVGLLPADKGIAAWREGFPVLGLSERESAALMFPQYDFKDSDVSGGV